MRSGSTYVVSGTLPRKESKRRIRSWVSGWVRSNDGSGTRRPGRKIVSHKRPWERSIFSSADARPMGSLVKPAASRSASNSRVRDSANCSSEPIVGASMSNQTRSHDTPSPLISRYGRFTISRMVPTNQQQNRLKDVTCFVLLLGARIEWMERHRTSPYSCLVRPHPAATSSIEFFFCFVHSRDIGKADFDIVLNIDLGFALAAGRRPERNFQIVSKLPVDRNSRFPLSNAGAEHTGILPRIVCLGWSA